MKRINILAFFLALTIINVNAQRAGDTISGIVTNNNGPMKMVIVNESDAKGDIVVTTSTDINGKFSFCLVDVRDRIQFSFVGYDSVDIPISKNYYEIEMIPRPQNMKVAIPHNGYTIVNVDSKQMKWLKQYVPQDYICGYIMRSPFGSIMYSLFLVRKEKGYDLSYTDRDKTETKRIESGLAQKLEKILNDQILSYDAPKSTNNQVKTEGLLDVTMVYEGFTAYAITSDKAVSFWTDMSKNLPDSIWQEELLKFNND